MSELKWASYNFRDGAQVSQSNGPGKIVRGHYSDVSHLIHLCGEDVEHIQSYSDQYTLRISALVQRDVVTSSESEHGWISSAHIVVGPYHLIDGVSYQGF